MEDKITQQFDINDLDIIDLLTDIKMDRNTAMVCVALKYDDGYGVTQTEINNVTGMYQSEISLVLKELIDKNVVKVNKRVKEEKKGKGRPKYEYCLCNGWNGFLVGLKQSLNDSYKNYEDIIEKLIKVS